MLLMPPLHISRIGLFLPVLPIILIPVFFPHVGSKKRLACVVPGLLQGYLGVIPALSHVRPCYLSRHRSQATQNVPYSSILYALTRIKPCCTCVSQDEILRKSPRKQIWGHFLVKVATLAYFHISSMLNPKMWVAKFSFDQKGLNFHF